MARVSIEDCLKHMDNRFALVKVAAQRARELISGEEPFLKSKNKECVTALREIAEGIVVQAGETTENRTDSLAYTANPALFDAPVAAEAAPVAAEATPATEDSESN